MVNIDNHFAVIHDWRCTWVQAGNVDDATKTAQDCWLPLEIRSRVAEIAETATQADFLCVLSVPAVNLRLSNRLWRRADSACICSLSLREEEYSHRGDKTYRWIARAAPASSLLGTTVSARSRTASAAFSTATPKPAHSIMPRSLDESPMAIT
jgi:hypothetical protein